MPKHDATTTSPGELSEVMRAGSQSLIEHLIHKATVDGDINAWGTLYGHAAAHLTSGGRIPQPLDAFMSGCLRSISELLLSRPREVRAVLVDAVMPGKRKPGPRRKMTVLQAQAGVYIDLSESEALGQKTRLKNELASDIKVDPDSLTDEVKRQKRKSRAIPTEPHPTGKR